MIDDFKKKLKDELSLGSVFTKKEQKQFPAEINTGSLAGRYVIKKLIFKHLKYEGNFHEIEILNDGFGKPILYLSGGIRELCSQRKIRTISCSISHSRRRVTGMIVIDY